MYSAHRGIVVPYVELKEKELGLITYQIVLCIFEVFKGQRTDKYKSVLDKYNIVPVYVPANIINHFKPLGLTVNGVVKTFLKEKFGNLNENEVTEKT